MPQKQRKKSRGRFAALKLSQTCHSNSVIWCYFHQSFCFRALRLHFYLLHRLYQKQLSYYSLFCPCKKNRFHSTTPLTMSTIVPIDINAIELSQVYKPTPEGYDEPQWPRCTEKLTKEFLSHFTRLLLALQTAPTPTLDDTTLAQPSTAAKTSRLPATPLKSLISVGLKETMKSFSRGVARTVVVCVPKVHYRAFFPAIPVLSALLRTPIVTLMCPSTELGSVFFPATPKPTKSTQTKCPQKPHQVTVQAFTINYWPELVPSCGSTPTSSSGSSINELTTTLQHRLDGLFAQLSHKPLTHCHLASTSLTTAHCEQQQQSLEPLLPSQQHQFTTRPEVLTVPATLRTAHETITPDLAATLDPILASLDQYGSICDLLWVRTQSRHLLQQHFTALLVNSLAQMDDFEGRTATKPIQKGIDYIINSMSSTTTTTTTAPAGPTKRKITQLDQDNHSTDQSARSEPNQGGLSAPAVTKRSKPNSSSLTLSPPPTNNNNNNNSTKTSNPNPFVTATTPSATPTPKPAPYNPFAPPAALSSSSTPNSKQSNSKQPPSLAPQSTNPFGVSTKTTSTPFGSGQMGLHPPKGVSTGLAKQPKIRLRETDGGEGDGGLVVVKASLGKDKKNKHKDNSKGLNSASPAMNNNTNNTKTAAAVLSTSSAAKPPQSLSSTLSLSFTGKPSIQGVGTSKTLSVSDLLNKATKKK